MITDTFAGLVNALAARGNILVMYSGGLDSHVLAMIASRTLGSGACAATLRSPVIPARDIDEAIAGARGLGITHVIIDVNELAAADFARNDPDRCYRCRKIRDRVVLNWAESAGFSTVAEGSNATDLLDYRPGLRASGEDGIWKPFIEFNITKEDIRHYARENGMTNWHRPATVCLCSRFPYGTYLDEREIRRVELAEQIISEMGYSPCRVRSFPHGLALVEVESPEALMTAKGRVAAALRALGFSFVGIDPEGYVSGKLNRELQNE